MWLTEVPDRALLGTVRMIATTLSVIITSTRIKTVTMPKCRHRDKKSNANSKYLRMSSRSI
jgi:hypothetical protein